MKYDDKIGVTPPHTPGGWNFNTTTKACKVLPGNLGSWNSGNKLWLLVAI